MDLYFKETGASNHETIIFLHGGGISSWMWDKQLEALKDYHCLVPDLPEHGRSIEMKPFTMKGSAKMIIDLIKERSLNGKAHVIGLSLGAQITVQILTMAPKVVDHALISGALTREIYGPKTLKMLNVLFKAYIPFKDIDFLIKLNMKSNGIPLEYFDEFKKDTKTLTLSSLRNVIKENMSFRIQDELCKAKNPVLITVGEKEQKIAYKSAIDLNKCLPNSKAYKVTNLGHSWPLESSKLFSDVLRAWINDKPLPKALSKL